MLGIETGAVSKAFLDDVRVGVAACYTFTGFDVAARQSTGSVESGFGAVYGRGSLGAFQIQAGAAYAGNALGTRRTVVFPGFTQTDSGKAGGERSTASARSATASASGRATSSRSRAGRHSTSGVTA